MINDGNSQTSLLPIFPEGEGTSVHRINIFRHFGQCSEFFLRSCLETQGGGHWGVLETAKPTKKSSKTAKQFGQKPKTVVVERF